MSMTGTIEADRLEQALSIASANHLVPVLFQLTGDEKWLTEPFTPRLSLGFAPDPNGGLDPGVVAELRRATRDAVLAVAGGATPAVPRPDADQLLRLMRACVGADVNEGYVPMIAEQLGYAPFTPENLSATISDKRPGFRVLVIGAGISGIATARVLSMAGVPFTVVDKNTDVGGTWWENRYPGARVDVPAGLYSYSFTRTRWKEHFSQRDEVAAYLQDTVDELGIRDAIRFGTEVRSLHWLEDSNRWSVQMATTDGVHDEEYDVVVTAVGLHNRPSIPAIDGLDAFSGPVVHSAQWPSEGVDTAGRRVGVIGTGASAMQVVSALGPATSGLTIFQREAHWVMPHPQYFDEVSDDEDWLIAHVPFYREWNRFILYWRYTETMYPALVVDPEWDTSRNSVNRYSEALRAFYTSYLESELEGREDLIEKCTPDFPVFGRRILLDNGWYRTLRQPHVSLVTDPITRIVPEGVVTADGTVHELDVLLLCTGFQQQRYLYPLEVVGRGGTDLQSEWQDDDARAYLGMTSPGFPNLFYLFGPNTNPPGGSWITIAEAQVHYVARIIEQMIEHDLAAVDCRREAYESYNEQVDEANSRLVFGQPGVDSYYRNRAGRVVTNTPWTVLQYWSRTREPDLADFDTTPLPTTALTR